MTLGFEEEINYKPCVKKKVVVPCTTSYFASVKNTLFLRGCMYFGENCILQGAGGERVASTIF